MPVTKPSCGSPLSKLRLSKGLTGRKVAHQLGITTQHLSTWERGVNAPSAIYLFQLARLYGRSANSLMQTIQATRKWKQLKSEQAA